MSSQFRHVALIGKHPSSGPASGATRAALEDIAHFLAKQGCEVAIEQAVAEFEQFGAGNAAAH